MSIRSKARAKYRNHEIIGKIQTKEMGHARSEYGNIIRTVKELFMNKKRSVYITEELKNTIDSCIGAHTQT